MTILPVSLADVVRARGVISDLTLLTPVLHSPELSQRSGLEVHLKMENLQRSGSFKIRGALAKIQSLSPAERVRGVIAASAGNHAQGVALGAARAGIPSTIVMPERAPLTKVTATRNYGAEVVLHGQTYDDAYRKARELQGQTGATFVHAFDDPGTIAGQGTIGLEILEQLSEVDTVVVPIGGGGLISGVAVAIKEQRPQARIIGVQAAGAPAAYLRLKKGYAAELEAVRTIADGIAVRRAGDLTSEIMARYVDEIVLVGEEEIAQAILLLLDRTKTQAEGAGAVGVAALLAGKIGGSSGAAVHPGALESQAVAGTSGLSVTPVTPGPPGTNSGKRPTAAVIVSGGNIDPNLLVRIIERGLVRSGRFARLATVVPDRPGELQKILGVVSAAGANVLSVHHDRWAPGTSVEEAEVRLTIETRDPDHLEDLIGALRAEGYSAKPVDKSRERL